MTNVPTEYIVAYNAFRASGVSDRDNTLNSTVVSIANQLAGGSHIQFTEEYLYEETIYTLFLILEAHHRFEYLDRVVAMGMNEGLIAEAPAYIDVVNAMYSIAYEVTSLRLEVAGLEQLRLESDIQNLLLRRIDRYGDLLTNAISCSEDIPQRDFQMVIGDSRVHPFEIYMGEIGDNIINSLSLKDPLLDVLVRQAVVMKWSTHMRSLQD